eukprot:3150132-Pleurochrysis_carterae.AAC.3
MGDREVQDSRVREYDDVETLARRRVRRWQRRRGRLVERVAEKTVGNETSACVATAFCYDARCSISHLVDFSSEDALIV